MKILTLRDLPKCDPNGKEIDTSFRNMINYTIALGDNELTLAEKFQIGIRLLYKEPQYTPDEIEGLLWFYSCGEIKESSKENSTNDNSDEEEIVDFELDAEAIYSSFLQAYGIRLTDSYMHWWEFKALMFSLPEDSIMGYRLKYRCVDLGDIPDETYRKEVERIKEHVSVENLRLMQYPEEERKAIRIENAKKKRDAWVNRMKNLQKGGK